MFLIFFFMLVYMKCCIFSLCNYRILNEIRGHLVLSCLWLCGKTFTLVIWVLSLLVFNVTCNDISFIYETVQMCRRTEEEVPTVGLQSPNARHFAEFFKVSVLHVHNTFQCIDVRPLKCESLINQGNISHNKTDAQFPPPRWGRRGLKPRIRPPYPQRVVKGD